MENKIEIYSTPDNSAEIKVRFDEETVWLNKNQMANLFQRDRSVISRHINNIFKEEELTRPEVCAFFAQTTPHGSMPGREQTKNVEFYNLDVIISVGYRVKSLQGTMFRQWATRRLREYLVQGYAINEKRLAQKQQEVEYLKTGIRIVSRAIEESADDGDKRIFSLFAKGLELLDDYDHEELDRSGKTVREAICPGYGDYMAMIGDMYDEFDSGIFAKPKDESFHSSINQIRQGFGDVEFYPTIEDKAANLLYFITKNHSFVDGNKRIAAACFLYFLQSNNALHNTDGSPLIDNNALAALTLFIAASKPDESEIVKRLVISILNRNSHT